MSFDHISPQSDSALFPPRAAALPPVRAPERLRRAAFAVAWAGLLGITGSALAADFPAGPVISQHGMKIAGVYIQPVAMAPQMPEQDPQVTDIHLEADIHAEKNNPQGFKKGDWIPGLTVEYSLSKKDSAWTAHGSLDPMCASDGPHYGANVRLDGPGQYQLLFTIRPPSGHMTMRHTDKETGVAAWWDSFEYKGSFKFTGAGKKGGY